MRLRKTVDTDLIMTLGPCVDWPRERVKKAVPKRIKVIDFLHAEHIPVEDRIWVVLHECFIPARELRHFACDCAERALSRVENPDKRSVDAVAVARRYADGLATDEELRAASRAASRAAYSAAYWAAYWAADRAADSAADSAACWADYSAAYWAASSAASWAADMAAERNWQLKRIEEILSDKR